MGLFRSSKGPIERIAEELDFQELLKALARSSTNSGFGHTPSRETNGSGSSIVKAVNPLHGAAKPGLLLVGGAAGLTAASAAVSAVRRKQQGS